MDYCRWLFEHSHILHPSAIRGSSWINLDPLDVIEKQGKRSRCQSNKIILTIGLNTLEETWSTCQSLLHPHCCMLNCGSNIHHLWNACYPQQQVSWGCWISSLLSSRVSPSFLFWCCLVCLESRLRTKDNDNQKLDSSTIPSFGLYAHMSYAMHTL